MKTKIEFKSVKTRMTSWFLFVAIIPLVIMSIIVYVQRVESIKAKAFSKLTAIRDLKVEQLNAWIDERMGDLKTATEDIEITVLEEIFKKQDRTADDMKRLRFASKILDSYIKNYEAYIDFFIINRVSGKIEISTMKSSEGQDKSRDLYFTEPIRSGEVYFKDIYYSKTINKPTMSFSIPIHSLPLRERIIGILVARINLERSLYDLLLDRTGMGKTGETLIVNKDVVALNELRWHENAPLKLKIKADPAVRASRGETGITETGDYRDEKVLAAYTHILRTNWGFVAKQDLKEIYAPIGLMVRQILILLLISVTGVCFIALFIARTIARPVIEMTEVSKRIEGGDLSARNPVMGADELGFLAQSFNDMADTMISQMSVQQGVAGITETMVAAVEMRDFGAELLKKLVETTGSNLGSFYLLSKDDNRFDHFHSIGVNPELLEPFDASILEGEFGKALATKKISHIKDIPEDTLFKFKTFAGTALPREIITIPIMVQERVMAVISLASLSAYSKVNLETLNQAWMVMNTAYSNQMATEETRILARDLDAKNQELEAQAEELQSLNEELQEQSEELQEQNVELEAQREQVEEANRLKSEFLSNMSHELRTPLNSIMALSRVLIMQAKLKLSEEEASYLEIIERNGKQLLALINDILDLAKIEAGRMDVIPRLFSLGSTIEMIVESIEAVAEEKGIQIIQEIPDHLLQIESDEQRVHQILQNIIGNAVKFTEKGNVTVSFSSDEERVYIEVKDTGIGISEEDLPYIFEEFRQVDGSLSRQYEGTGLGLTISYRAAKMLGGEISVESTRGKGSLFTLSLPSRWKGTAPVYEPIHLKPPAEIRPERKTILVIDDEPDVVTMISDDLIGAGYHTITATSGKEALELAKRHRPFAITLDVIMPEMDGWEVLQKLKENPETADIPVIIVSVSEDKETGFALGAVGYITKPVDRNAFILEIRKIGGPYTYSVMVVDDNETDRREIARIVEGEKMKAILAAGGKECMDLLKKSVPEVLVLDLMMPEMDGFQVLDRMRKEPATRNLPVIVVTAKDLTIEDRKRLSGNVSSILTKTDMAPMECLEVLKKIILEIEQHPERPGALEAKAGNRILLVEDNEAAIIQVRNALEDKGYLVDVVRGGGEALDYLKHRVPDGIILDLMMPEVDGFEVLEKIRSTPATAKIPVLILTAKDLTPEDYRRLGTNNIQQLIQKGDVEREDLLFKVKLMLGSEQGFKPESVVIEREIARPAPKKEEATKIRDKEGAPTILVVEDNPDNMITIKAVLKNEFKILEAIDGEEGLKKTLTELPDLVLLDMGLPKMDGFTVVRKIKDDEKAGHIPVIALTAHAMKEVRERILEAGCDDYISKPIDPEGTLEKIKKWVKGTTNAKNLSDR